LYRLALKGAVAAACPGSKIIEADCVAGLFDALGRHPHVDLLLLDLNLPGAYGFNVLAYLRGSRPELPVLVISASDDPRTMRRALAFGAQGFVSKSADAAAIGRQLQAALRGEAAASTSAGPAAEPAAETGALEVAERMAQLTPQQFRVFGMLCAGRLNKQIGYDLKVTEATIKAHMTVILRKLGAANRTQAVLLARRLARETGECGPFADDVE
jgi:DNA-binding NarL/FixJ family response regulator